VAPLVATVRVKARRRVGPDGRSTRTPTVRRIKPAITPVSRRTPAPGAAAVARPGTPGASRAAVTASGSASLDLLGGRPVDLQVDLGRGLVLGTPLMAAAGAFGYGVEVADLVDLPRLGAIVTRGTSLKPRSGQPAPRTAEIPAGLLLGIGVQNPGLDLVLERYATTWAGWPVPVILNLCVESAAELAEALRRLEGAAGIAGIELNLSCPNAARGGTSFGLDADAAGSLVAAARRATDLPVIAKLTAAATDVRAIARAVEDAGADVISAINTLPGLALAADRRGPALGSRYGGIAGPALRPVALRVVWEIAQVVDVPVIGIGGVAALDDVLDLLAAGASAVGVGTAALADPMLPVSLAEELADACRARGIERVSALVGTALPARAAPPSIRGAEYGR
jgi:dihydroorotate dehydrogenase (NAD+) catalytic subunit